jgi:hypothetical protein
MKKSELIAAIQREILRHEFSTFVDEPPVSSKGGKGVVIPGCPSCRKRANTTTEFWNTEVNGRSLWQQKRAPNPRARTDYARAHERLCERADGSDVP